MIKLNDFKCIYRFFLGQNSRWMVKNLCNLIIAVGFNFCANLTVRYSLNCWDQSITVGSSQDFKSDHLNVSPIYRRYILDISPIFYRKIKLTHVRATDLIFP